MRLVLLLLLLNFGFLDILHAEFFTSAMVKTTQDDNAKNIFQTKVEWQNINLSYEIVGVDNKTTSYQIWALATFTLIPFFLLAQAYSHPQHTTALYIATGLVAVPITVGWTLFVIELGNIK